MSSINKVILVGRVGNDPETKQFDNSTLATFSLATSKSWTDRDSGDKQEKTEWHRCTTWGKRAEFVNQFVQKGALLFVEGEIVTRKWIDKKDESQRSITEIQVNNIQILSNTKNSGDQVAVQDEAGQLVEDNIPF